MREDLCGEGVYETYYEPEVDGPGAKRMTRRLGTVRAVTFDPVSCKFMLLVADEQQNLVARPAADVHLKRLPKAP